MKSIIIKMNPIEAVFNNQRQHITDTLNSLDLIIQFEGTINQIITITSAEDRSIEDWFAIGRLFQQLIQR